MGAFFAPTRRKLLWTLIGMSVIPAAFLLCSIPHAHDPLDLEELGETVLIVLIGYPILAFNAVTGSAFAIRTEVSVFIPSLPQLAFALCANIALFYFLACVGSRWRERRDAGRAAQRSSPT